jgi:hypothetical protein
MLSLLSGNRPFHQQLRLLPFIFFSPPGDCFFITQIDVQPNCSTNFGEDWAVLAFIIGFPSSSGTEDQREAAIFARKIPSRDKLQCVSQVK